MKKLLIVVDMQNDFISGSLGTPEAVAIVPNVVKKIRDWEGDIITTQDTHYENYLDTREGKRLPVPHCIVGTEGYNINDEVMTVLVSHENTVGVNKLTFGSIELPEMIRDDRYDYIELIGLCTDICVVSNALILKANYPETDIAVDASCCAGVTPQTHEAALRTMEMCQIDVLNKAEPKKETQQILEQVFYSLHNRGCSDR